MAKPLTIPLTPAIPAAALPATATLTTEAFFNPRFIRVLAIRFRDFIAASVASLLAISLAFCTATFFPKPIGAAATTPPTPPITLLTCSLLCSTVLHQYAKC